MELCPCGSDYDYTECCEPYHLEKALPATCEDLMRARYSAFVKKKIDFIANTHTPETTDFNIDEAREWSVSSNWKLLEIVDTDKGEENDTEGSVEFKAYYSDKNDQHYEHHEFSTFVKVDGKWLYKEGRIIGTETYRRETPKVGRNEPCPCGSGKKFKKCCGK